VGFSSPPISPVQALNRIRDLVQQKQWKLIFLDFRAFLFERHGSNWASTLCAARAEQRIRAASSLTSALKRSRGGKEAMISSLILNAAQGCAALWCFTNESWWDWKLGSTLCFWRWGEALPLSHVRDGIPIFVMGELPRASSNQRGPAKYKAPLLASKLDKVLERQYIRKGPVKASIDYFDVPKGPADIRVVYHVSKSGLNAQLWTPHFYIPNGSAATNVMSFETYLTDLDVRAMFPNFPMDPKLRPHAGVDLRSLSHCLKNYETPISDEESERWERLFMGMATSLYIAIRMYYVAEEFCRGPTSAKDNPMGYDEVRLNLPGSSDYNPSLPRVMKWNQAAKAISGDVVTFVDDLRASGHSVEN
jgi:hypothetical protein